MLGTILFIILALIAIVSALGMLTSNNAVHAALFLVVNFVSIALFYLGLSAAFLAMVQVTVYAGAIMVLFLFVIMMLGAERVPMESNLRWQRPVAIFLVFMLIGVSALILFSPASDLNLAPAGPIDQASMEAETFGGPASLGQVLFASYALPLEIVGILLLVAMIGAVVLTRDEKPAKARQSTRADADAQAAAD